MLLIVVASIFLARREEQTLWKARSTPRTGIKSTPPQDSCHDFARAGSEQEPGDEPVRQESKRAWRGFSGTAIMTMWRLVYRAPAVAMLLALWGTSGTAQGPNRASKIYERLSKLPPDAELEVILESRARLQGVVERFSETELVLAGRPQPIPLANIHTIKRIRAQSQLPVWNPLTGFVRTWKTAAIVGGLIVAVALLVAYETE